MTTDSASRGRDGACTSAGETPCSLFEATLQPHCTYAPYPGLGPNFYDSSLVDGYNIPVAVHTVGGYNVRGVRAGKGGRVYTGRPVGRLLYPDAYGVGVDARWGVI
jgi:hypothetical protein